MISVEIPIRTISEANNSDHWQVKRKRKIQQQFFVRCALDPVVSAVRFPCTVTLCRLATRTLDDDNLVTCFKAIRDECSECLLPEYRKTYIDKNNVERKIKGRADSDPRISWAYSQEKSKKYAIRITITWTKEPS